MTIRRDDLEESDEQRTAREEKEQEAVDAEAQRVSDLEEKSRQNELKAAKAEAALDEARRRPEVTNSNVAPQISEEQWQAAEQRTGKTRDQIIADANLQQGMINSALKPVLDEVKSAREEARAAKEETAKIKARKGLDSVESDFYKKNPALEGHKGAVQDFLDTYPDKDSVDGDTYKKRLELARDVVKGRVKENMNTRRRTEGSSRIEGGDQDDHDSRGTEDEESDRLDPRGLPNKGARLLMESVMEKPGGRLNRGEDTIKDFKKFRDDEGRGVQIDDSDEWARGEQIRSRRDRIGGSRGER